MGQKNSSSKQYLLPLPEIYEKDETSEVYSIRGFTFDTGLHSALKIKVSSPITNPETVTDSEEAKKVESSPQELSSVSEPLEEEEPSTVPPQSQPVIYQPPFLKHFTILLNKFETREYLNHLVYRNQPEFRDFIVQMPFGQVEKQDKYTKVHLYVDELVFTLNQLFNLPFYDMAIILYTSLLAYKYLYSYFGMFKIEPNMIGFTREAKTKVWLNSKLTKDKPLPIVTDINLKRHKEEESYMVDDLLTIFTTKLDKQTLPPNFTLINNTSNIRTSRNTRLNYSKVADETDLSKSTVTSLENNLISDFSDSSFDKCLEYLETYFGIERPGFLVQVKSDQKEGENQKSKRRPHINFVGSVFELIKTKKDFTVTENTDLKSSRANLNINMREITGVNLIPMSNQRNYPQNTSGLQFKTHNGNHQIMAESIVRPNFIINSVPLPTISIQTQSHRTPVKAQPPQPQIRFTNSSYLPPNQNIHTSPSIQIQQQTNINKSKSKPKITFNHTISPVNDNKINSPSSLYQRISPHKVYSSAIVQNQQINPNSSLEKRQIVITPKNTHHGNIVSPQKVNENDFSFRITTSQVHPVYTKSEVEQQKELKHVLSSENIKVSSEPQSNWESDEKNDKDSIIDEITKV